MNPLFDKNFYPTPKSIAYKMCGKITKTPQSILEPSAGKGDLLDVIKKRWSDYACFKALYCIEKDRNLQHILTGKGYNLIDSDFLTYTGAMKFSLILMNPPFDTGVHHLLKAWGILYNGEIVCLLNQETYDNPYTKERKLLKTIIDEHGEFERLGACFDNAERKTGVQVIMVYLKKENNIEKDYFEGLKDGGNHTFQKSFVNESQLAIKGDIEVMVTQYNKAIEKATEGFIKLQEASWYERNITAEYNRPMEGSNGSVVQNLFSSRSDYTENLNNTLNEYIQKLKTGAWKNILNLTKFKEAMTAKIRQDFESKINILSQMEFTVENIDNLLHELRMSGDSIMNQAVLDAFDLITKYHKENRVHFEGWKTNSCYKIGKRFILPYAVRCENWGRGDVFRSEYHRQYEIADIEKVCAMLDGKKLPLDSVHQSLTRNETRKSGECSYFKLKWYQKGTMHFEFKDLKLLERFNYIACLGKKWLPPADCNEPEAKRIMIEYNNKI